MPEGDVPNLFVDSLRSCGGLLRMELAFKLKVKRAF